MTLNIKALLFQMRVYSFHTLIYQLIQLLKMISNCCSTLNAYGNRQSSMFTVNHESFKIPRFIVTN